MLWPSVGILVSAINVLMVFNICVDTVDCCRLRHRPQLYEVQAAVEGESAQHPGSEGVSHRGGRGVPGHQHQVPGGGRQGVVPPVHPRVSAGVGSLSSGLQNYSDILIF